MNTQQIMELCNKVRKTAYAIHQYHGNGYLEKVYENALVHRLSMLGLEIKQQHQLVVYDEDGTAIGEYCADLLIDNELIVELKACRTLTDEHYAQLLNYLKGTGIEHGLLINFGSYRFQIKKFVKSLRAGRNSPNLLLLFFALSVFFRGYLSMRLCG